MRLPWIRGIGGDGTDGSGGSMSNKVHIAVSAGPMNGKTFAFDEHDAFLFGRLPECHCCLPDDSMISRRHI